MGCIPLRCIKNRSTAEARETSGAEAKDKISKKRVCYNDEKTQHIRKDRTKEQTKAKKRCTAGKEQVWKLLPCTSGPDKLSLYGSRHPSGYAPFEISWAGCNGSFFALVYYFCVTGCKEEKRNTGKDLQSADGCRACCGDILCCEDE